MHKSDMEGPEMSQVQQFNLASRRRKVLAGLLSAAFIPALARTAGAQVTDPVLGAGFKALSTPLAVPLGLDRRGQASMEVRPVNGFSGPALIIMPRGGTVVAAPNNERDADNQGLAFLDNMRVAGDGGFSTRSGYQAASMDGISCGDENTSPHYAAPFILSRIKFYGLRNAINLRVALESHIRDCFFRACDTGIQIGVEPGKVPINAISIANCHFRKCKAGIAAGNTRWNQIHVTNSTFEANLGPALSLRRAGFEDGRVALTAEGCWFEQNNGTDWDIEADFDGPLVLRDCSLGMTSTHNKIPWVGRYDFGRCDTVLDGGSIVANGASKSLLRSRGRLTFRDSAIRMRGRRLRHVGMDFGGADPAAFVTYDNCRLEMVSHLTPDNPQVAPTEFRGFTRFGGMTGVDEQRAIGSGFQLLERRPSQIDNRAPDPGFREPRGRWQTSALDPPSVSRIPFGRDTNALRVDWRGGARSDDKQHNLILLQEMILGSDEFIAVSLALRASFPPRRLRLTLMDPNTGRRLCEAQAYIDGNLRHTLLVGRNDSASKASVSLILSAADLGRSGYALQVAAPQCSTGSLAAIQPVLRGGFNVHSFA